MMMRITTLLLLLLAFNANAETTLEIGLAFASGDPGNAVLILGERGEKYGIALGLMERHYVQADGEKHTIDPNMFVEAMRFWQTPKKRWELGIGPAYFQNTSRALTKNFNFSVLLRFNLDENVAITVRHWSNASTDAYNMGLDFIGISFGFGNGK